MIETKHQKVVDNNENKQSNKTFENATLKYSIKTTGEFSSIESISRKRVKDGE